MGNDFPDLAEVYCWHLEYTFKLRTRETLYSWTCVLWPWCLFYKSSCLFMGQKFFWQGRNFSEFPNQGLLYLHYSSGFKHVYNSLRSWLMPCCQWTVLFTGSTLKIYEFDMVPTFFCQPATGKCAAPPQAFPAHRTGCWPLSRPSAVTNMSVPAAVGTPQWAALWGISPSLSPMTVAVYQPPAFQTG